MNWKVNYPAWNRHYSQALSATKTFDNLPDSLAFVLANFQTWKTGYSIFSVDSAGNSKQFLHWE